MNEEKNDRLKKLVDLCKGRGIIFQNSLIYGGMASTWDYGPLGVLIKMNIKASWWKNFVQKREEIYGLDSAILSLPNVWKASGHLDSFHDELVDCKSCKQRFRFDALNVEKKTQNSLTKDILSCPACGGSDLTEKRNFHLMFKTYQGAVESQASSIYLRPETAQGIFLNFKQVKESMRPKIPFGIAQIGKAFRNEITPGNFIFRLREFEQMEIEYFIHPKEEDKHFKLWIDDCKSWFLNLGIQDQNLRIRSHEKDELAHYSTKTSDIEYAFPFGWGELQGIACRGDYDLSKHQEHSGEILSYRDDQTKEEYIPYVIEPSFGLDRTVMALLLDAYKEDELENGQKRSYLSLTRDIAPIKLAVLPLKRNHQEIRSQARRIFSQVQELYHVQYDDRGSIGKLYRKQDEIGTPFCITVDFDSIDAEKKTLTIRERDSMKQDKIAIHSLNKYLEEAFSQKNT